MADWNAVVREHGPLVWRVAFRLLGNDADAADCFQRTFVSALESIAPAGVRDWPALLRQVATNRALEQLRERYRRAARAGPLPGTLLPDDAAADPLDAAAGEELAGRLRHALARIDPRQAEVFCLASLEGWSYSDISARVGVTANHVGVLLSRARAALRDELRAFDPARRHHHEPEGQP